jgi:hydrogenase maturation protein HypF
MKCCQVHVTGIVQGVGFRPWVWSTATRHGLSGWVRNTSSGVDIVIEGEAARVAAFLQELHDGGPPLAAIEAIEVTDSDPSGRRRFMIVESRAESGRSLPISPDVGTCEDCLRELWSPDDRRYRYPFINCTQCGPRFTIVHDIPYDRPNTTMADFPMCTDCEAEYRDRSDRRFHAQPVACPACGPQIWIERAGEPRARGDAALREVRRRITAGEVVAVKGLGGFHLACDATATRAVARLRERKQREAKPFALMAANVATIERHAVVTRSARELLHSPQRPIVLLERKRDSAVAEEVAPGRHQLGFMLPYTPLHHLLFESDGPEVLVMTSGNASDEPIAYENSDARTRLSALADTLLLHDRPIHVRCDDSVTAEFRNRVYFFRRSRGYTPMPLRLPNQGLDAADRPLLAVGGELKNVFCLTRDGRAYLGHHIGELQYLDAMRSFEAGVEHFERLFRIDPKCIVHDLHPDYRSTRYAQARATASGVPALAVQHHHAHVASCTLDNGMASQERVIGVAFDGTGYGTDGAIWGGEFLVADHAQFERALHLLYCPLPGGDAATRHPYRIALAWLQQLGIEWHPRLPCVGAATDPELQLLATQLESRVNTPPTSSMGRLFDAVASLVGLCHHITYEAEAACLLESAAHEFASNASGATDGGYPFDLSTDGVDPRPAFEAILADLKRDASVPEMAARFHNGVARMVVDACRMLREAHGLHRVALTGGVWQNLVLLRRSVQELEEAGFEVLWGGPASRRRRDGV